MRGKKTSNGSVSKIWMGRR